MGLSENFTHERKIGLCFINATDCNKPHPVSKKTGRRFLQRHPVTKFYGLPGYYYPFAFLICTDHLKKVVTYTKVVTSHRETTLGLTSSPQQPDHLELEKYITTTSITSSLLIKPSK